MLYYNKNEGYKGVYINKTKRVFFCHYWYFLGKCFKFQPDVCNGCADVLMMSINLHNIAVLDINAVGFGCVITGISKFEAANLLQNAILSKKVDHYKI